MEVEPWQGVVEWAYLAIIEYYWPLLHAREDFLPTIYIEGK